jgi:hypothetical protein
MNTTSTRQVSIDQLSEGDVVLAINGKDRPFPYTVTRVINTDVTPRRGKAYRMTQVRYAHGGIIPPCDPTTAVATVAV